MSDPSYAIQVALVGRLINLVAAIGERVYDDVPPAEEREADTGADFPYVSLGSGQLVPIDEECFDRSTTTIDINVWSRAVGFPEAKQIAGEIRMALHHQSLEIQGHVLDGMTVESTNYLRDPDGKTRRARISLSVDTQPAPPAAP